MGYVRVCPVCGSQDLGMPRKIESMPGFSVNERCYCNNCRNESVPLLLDTEIAPESNADEHFQTIDLVPIDTINHKNQAMVSEINWNQKLQPTEHVEAFASYKKRLLENTDNLNVMVLDLCGINYAQTNYRVLKEVVKHKYRVYLDPGIQGIADIFDAFTLDTWKVVCNSICAKSSDVFEEAFEISDHVLPCIYLHEGKVIWKSSSGEREVSRAVRQLERMGFDEIGIIDVDRFGVPVDSKHVKYIAELYPNIIYGGGINRDMLPMLKDSGLAGAIIDAHGIKTN